MPVTGTIAGGVIKIALAGLEAAKTQLAGIAAQSKKLGDALGSIGSASARGFAVASGGVMGFLKAADPVRFEIFTQKLTVLSIYIGMTFIPILDAAIATLDKLIAYFKSLTDEQRESILHWTKIALVVLGAGAALGVILAIVSKGIGLLRTFATVINIVGLAVKALLSGTGIGALVVILGTLAFAVYEILKATGALDPIFKLLESTFGKFGEVVGPMIETVTAAFAPLMQAIMDLVKVVIGPLMEIGAAFLELAMAILAPIMEIIGAFLKLAAIIAGTIFKVLLTLIEAILTPLAQILGVLAKIIKSVVEVVVKLVEVFTEIIKVVAEIVGTVLSAFSDILVEIVGVLADLFKSLWEAFGPTIIDAIQTVAEWAKDVLEVIKEMVDAAKDLVDVLDSVNPFSSDSGGAIGDSASGEPKRNYYEDPVIGSKNKKLNPTGAGVYDDKSGSVGGGGDYGGGGDDDGGGGTGTGKDPKFMPKTPVQRVEQFGLEEAFKKAQAGASFDPTKIAENERKKILADQLDTQKRIEENTRKEKAALSSF